MQVVVLFLVVCGVIGARSVNNEKWTRLAVLGMAVVATVLLFNYRFV
jgi:hypothetical protein